MIFTDLLPEIHTEIFRLLKPYTLYNASRTSKQMGQIALADTLWKKHLDSEFPYCLEKGSNFEKYGKSKWKLLRQINYARKCALLIEAGHLNELSEISTQYSWANFLTIATLGNKSLLRIMNEQNDQAMLDFFYSKVCKEDPWSQSYYAAAFGKVEDLKSVTPNYQLIHAAVKCSSIATLEYFVLQVPSLPIDHSYQAADNGGMEIVQWFSDHGAQFDDDDFTGAVWRGQKDFVLFFLEKMKPSPELIKKGVERAVESGQPGPLEVLLPHFSKDIADLNHLLDRLAFCRSPNNTAACLKILLDRGADVNHLARITRHTPLFRALCYPNNEESIEILLNKKANPNITSYPLLKAVENYDLPIIKMLIDHGVIVTAKIIDEAVSFRPPNPELNKIIELLKSHAI